MHSNASSKNAIFALMQSNALYKTGQFDTISNQEYNKISQFGMMYFSWLYNIMIIYSMLISVGD